MPQTLSVPHAIGLTFLCFFLASCCDAATRFFQDSGLHFTQIIFLGNILPLFVVLPYLHRTGELNAVLTTPKRPLHIGRSLIISGSVGVVVYTLGRLPLVDFYGFVFLIPILLTLAAGFLYREHVNPYHWFATITGFGGILLVLGSAFSNPSPAYLLAIAIPLLGAGQLLVARKIRDDHWLSFMVWQNLITCAVYILPALYFWTLPTLSVIAALVVYAAVLGVVNILFGLVYSRTPSLPLIAPIHYSQIIWGLTFGWFFFHQQPAGNTMMGIGVILGAGAMLWMSERDRKNPADQDAELVSKSDV